MSKVRERNTALIKSRTAAHARLREILEAVDTRYRVKVAALDAQLVSELTEILDVVCHAYKNPDFDTVRQKAVNKFVAKSARHARLQLEALTAARKRHPWVKLPRHRVPNPPKTLLNASPKRPQGRPRKYTADDLAGFVERIDARQAAYAEQQRRLTHAEWRELSSGGKNQDTLSVAAAIRADFLHYTTKGLVGTGLSESDAQAEANRRAEFQSTRNRLRQLRKKYYEIKRKSRSVNKMF